MLTQVLFHPDHIVPAVKFTAAAIKFSHHAVAKTLVEMYTIPGQILVFYFTGGNAGIQILNVLQGENLFQYSI